MNAVSRYNRLQLIGLITTALICILGVGLLQTPQLNKLKGQAEGASLQEIQAQEKSERLYLNLLHRTPAFGFNNLMGDWVFLRFLQYFGDTPARNQAGYSLSPEYFEVILDRDPYFRDAYFFLSGSTTLYAGMPEQTVEIINQHVDQLSPMAPPKAYFIWRYKGTDELLFLGDGEAALNSFQKATDWADAYSDPESTAARQASQQMVEYLTRNPESKSAQIGAWMMVLSNAFDENTQKLAIRRIQELGAEISVDAQGRLQIVPPAEPTPEATPSSP